MYTALIKKATCEAVFKCRKAGMGSGLIFHIILPYSGKLSREKTFVNFTVLWLFAKVFSGKLGACCPLAWQKRAIYKSFRRENCIFHQFVKVFVINKYVAASCGYIIVHIFHQVQHTAH